MVVLLASWSVEECVFDERCVCGCALIVSSVSFHGNIKIIIEQVKKLHYCAMSDVSPVYCARCSGPTCSARCAFSVLVVEFAFPCFVFSRSLLCLVVLVLVP